MRHRRRLHRRERKLRNKKIIISMFALVLFLSCGYAAFQTSISLKAKGTIKEATSVASLKKLVVTSGDGLYSDSTETDRYVYKGSNPNNYIQVQETDLSKALYRIISIESDGTLKVIRNDDIGNIVFDPGYSTSISGLTDANSVIGTRYSSSSTDYCYKSSETSYYGCNVWGSKTTMLDSDGNNVTAMPKTYGGTTLLDLPTSEAYINTYLNSTWLNTLNSNFLNKIKNHLFNVGSVVLSSSQTLVTDLAQEQSYKWKGKVALMNVTDYVKATNNTACTGVYAYLSKSDCYSSASIDNWIYSSSYCRMVNPNSESSSTWLVFYSMPDGRVNTVGYRGFKGASDPGNYSIRPTLFLSSDIKLLGSGSSSEPYRLV